jgi:hypothetical protein
MIFYKNNGNFFSFDGKILIKKMCEEKNNLFPSNFYLGMKFRCSVLIAPVKTESCDIILYILEFTDSNDRNRRQRMRMRIF